MNETIIYFIHKPIYTIAEFPALLFQSSVSHDPSEIVQICWFTNQETYFLMNVENSCSAWYFLWKPWYIFLRIVWWAEGSKEQIYCNFWSIECIFAE